MKFTAVVLATGYTGREAKIRPEYIKFTIADMCARENDEKLRVN